MMPFPFPKPPPRSPIQIDPNDLEIMRRLQNLIEDQQMILNNLQYSLEKQIQDKYGVDFSQNNWTINLSAGVLERDTE